MLYCEECGARIIPGSRFCEECGAKVDYALMYCENCGAELIPDSKFCGQCGTKVNTEGCSTEEINSKKHNPDLLSNGDFLEYVKAIDKGRNKNDFGLILINTDECDDVEGFKSVFLDYIEFTSQHRQIDYYFIDIARLNVSESIDQVLEEVIIPVYSTVKPDYLLLVGDENSIPCMSFENRAYDGDLNIISDLPYLTLSTDSPFDGYSYDFKACTPVGRIPASSGDDFELAQDYFRNVMDYSGDNSVVAPFGLSALVWRGESASIYKEISKEPVLCCPEITLNILEDYSIAGINNDVYPNLLYFNLHGSDQTQYWYGQDGGSYPEAVSPDVISEVQPGYFIGVEACYGATYVNCTDEESILKTSLHNGCLAFLGSSEIAYGTSEEPGCDADVVIRRFIKGIANGKTAGDSYMDSLIALSAEDMDDAAIKTMAEFALFGDPCVCMGKQPKTGKLFNWKSSSIHVTVPDVRKRVEMKLSEANEKINSIVNDYAYKNYSQFKGIVPKVYEVNGKGSYQSMYEKTNGKVKEILKVYYDKNSGKIRKTLISK